MLLKLLKLLLAAGTVSLCSYSAPAMAEVLNSTDSSDTLPFQSQFDVPPVRSCSARIWHLSYYRISILHIRCIVCTPVLS